MDNLLEILVALIFAAIYFFGNLFSKSGEDEDSGPGGTRRERGGADPEAEERQRKIQDEIRRKIMERRRAASGEAERETAPEEASADPVASPSQMREESAERRRDARQRERAEAKQAAEAEAASHWQPEEREAFSWDTSNDAYDSEIEKQQKRIEETKRRADELKRKAAEAGGEIGSNPVGTRQVGSSRQVGSAGNRRSSLGLVPLSGNLRDSFADPGALRTAFVYREVLGPPVGLRGRESDVPGLRG